MAYIALVFYGALSPRYKEIARETKEFIKTLSDAGSQIYLIQPYPGTYFYEHGTSSA